MKRENQPQSPEPIASNKSASMVTKNTRKLVTVLAYAFLEWVLILLLLMNSFFSCMIRRFAAYFGLKPPCSWCSRLDHHLLEPTKSSHPFIDLVCEAHAKEISNLTYCSNHKKLAESKGLCQECFCFETYANCQENLMKCSCTCCGKMLSMKGNDGGNHSGLDCEHQIISDIGSFGIRESADDDSNAEDEINAVAKIQICDSLSEDAKEVGEKLVNGYEKARQLIMPDAAAGAVVTAISKQHKHAGESEEIEIEADPDTSSAIQLLKSDLEAERTARNDLYVELEAERSAAAIAANQTMAMITRLQEEKAAMQMEALQYQRVMEEQAEYDQQALQLLNELVAKREREKQELEKELDVYRGRVSDYEAKDKALMMIKKCGDLTSPSNLDSDSDVLSIDLNCGYEKEEEGRRDISLLDRSKEWGAIEDSLEELDYERLSIMRQLEELEEKLLVHQGEEGNENGNQKNPNAELLCNQEVNLGSCCFVENRPKTMASVARNLLDLVVSSESESEDNELNGEVGCDEGLVVCTVENGSERLAIQKEMDHVYGRLQALEADTEFLRHCIASVSKGNHGANVLQEILEHLRELRATQFCF
uniref:GTD-binding domain-containing protein n=1 Tax=Opuntia streptacantha TaxID=393608 RepID=A0A7C9EC08_OPUST